MNDEVQFNLPVELKAQLDDIVARKRISRSEAIRQAIRRWCALERQVRVKPHVSGRAESEFVRGERSGSDG